MAFQLDVTVTTTWGGNMSADAVTRVDVPTQSSGVRVSLRRVDPVGPTPVWLHIRRELVRIAEQVGGGERWWSASWDGSVWHARAYVGRPGCVVAVAEREDLRTAVAALLGALMEAGT